MSRTYTTLVINGAEDFAMDAKPYVTDDGTIVADIGVGSEKIMVQADNDGWLALAEFAGKMAKAEHG
jgi:hypothetical protein